MIKPIGSNRIRGVARIGLVFAIVAALLVSWGAWSRHRAFKALEASTDAQLALPVEVITPANSAGVNDLVLPGELRATTEAPIYARTDGYLRRWLVDIGTEVKAGQLLAEIDAPELDQQLRAAQAELTNSEASQAIARISADRWRDLRDTDSVSKQEADEKLSSATASDAAVQAAQANVQRLRELSAYKRIVAPFDGVITERNTDVGALISSSNSAGAQLFRIADKRALLLYVRVPQSYSRALKPGTAAEVAFPDHPGRTYPAKLSRTAGAIDGTTRTVLAQLSVEDPNGELLPGAYAEVHFKLPADPGSPALRLPANTLLSRGDGLSVATVGVDDKVVLKHIVIGRDFGKEIEIASGLTAEDRVILAPPDSIIDATPVRIVAGKDPA